MSKADKGRSSEDNFRVRVAQQKRERMRLRLLGATMSLCAERRGVGPLVIDEVVQRAEVSRGTFYKYFDSVDALVEELGRHLVDDLVQSLRLLVTDQPDPLMRICMGNCVLLIRASIEPAWGGFVSHTVYVSDAKSMFEGMREAVIAGREAGHFVCQNVDVAVDFHIGLALQSMRRVLRSGLDEAYILDVAAFAISGLGVDPGKAADIARRALRELLVVGPVRLGWWRAEPLAALAPPASAAEPAKAARAKARRSRDGL